jgi:hypothetical protein
MADYLCFALSIMRCIRMMLSLSSDASRLAGDQAALSRGSLEHFAMRRDGSAHMQPLSVFSLTGDHGNCGANPVGLAIDLPSTVHRHLAADADMRTTTDALTYRVVFDRRQRTHRCLPPEAAALAVYQSPAAHPRVAPYQTSSWRFTQNLYHTGGCSPPWANSQLLPGT